MRRPPAKANAGSISAHEALQDNMCRYFGDAGKAGQLHSCSLDPLDMLGGNANDHVNRTRHGMDGFDRGHRPHLRCDLGAASAPLKPYHEVGHLTGLTIAADNCKSGDGAGGLQLG